MRLREIATLLESVNRDALNVRVTPLDRGCSFAGLADFRSAVNGLEFAPGLSPLIEALKSSPLFTSEGDAATVTDPDTADQLREKVRKLDYGVKALAALFQEIMPAGAAAVLHIQIPEPVSIKKLIYVCGKLEKALQGSIVSEQTGGQAAIQHIDPGADWIEVNVGAEAALALAADLVWSAALVYGKYQEAKVFEEHVKALNIKPESLEDVRKGQNDAIVRLIHSESAYLVDKHLQGNGGQLERFKAPIKLMADLIKDGVRISPSALAPDNIQVLFPDFDDLGATRPRLAEEAAPVQAPVQPAQAAPAAPKEKPAAVKPAKTEKKEAPEAPKDAEPAAPKPAPEPKSEPAAPKPSLSDTVDLEV